MKYEAIFTKQEPIDWGQTRHFWAPERNKTYWLRLTDQSFWHSMLNDGQVETPTHNWPYFNEYNSYKAWFDEVEDKALNTLKTAVAQLLADFDDRSMKEFSGKGQSKRAQLEKLLASFEGHDALLKGGKKTKQKAKKDRKLTSSKRDSDQINRLLDEAIEEDIHLKGLLDKERASLHPMI